MAASLTKCPDGWTITEFISTIRIYDPRGVLATEAPKPYDPQLMGVFIEHALRGLRFKVEACFSYGWDDAGWTETVDGQDRPLRFTSLAEAQEEIDDHLRLVREAVAAGQMEDGDTEYRIVLDP